MKCKLITGLMVPLFLVSTLTTVVSISAQILGDTDGDGTVDIFDGVIIRVAFGSAPDKDNWNPDADLADS